MGLSLQELFIPGRIKCRLEAEDKAEAMMSVPTFLHGQAKVVQLTKFQAEKVQAMHVK